MADKHKTITGNPISSGIVLGQTRTILPGEVRVAELPVAASAINEELAALDRAVEDTVAEIKLLREAAGKKIGGPVAKIFDAQLLIASDEDFLKQVRAQVTQTRRNAAFVYNGMVQKTLVPLNNAKEPYMQQMAGEIEAVAARVLSHLAGYKEDETARFPADTIIVGHTFTPGEILAYRNRRAVGFVIAEGGKNSHMALIARSLMIPVIVVAESIKQIPDGVRIVLDAITGQVVINPTPEEVTEYGRKRRRQGSVLVTRISKLSQVPPTTADGMKVYVQANLELPGPLDEILSMQKFTVGLYRTEFLYLEHASFPDEEEQYSYYARIAETFAGTYVVLRTFDLGSDKVKDDGLMPKEDNPALGWRGIRPMLAMSDIFKQQIRAMLRASTRGNLKIMLPMIADISEYEHAMKLISQVKFELRKKNLPFDDTIDVGIMVEVPSAALMADELAQRVDFMSVGTNDLTQYTLSADRNNARVSELYNPLHPAVLNLVRMTVEACRKYQKPMGICGEVAGDPLAIPLFVGMGVRHLSMNPAKIFDACRLIRKVDSGMARALAGSVLASDTVASVQKKLQNYNTELEK